MYVYTYDNGGELGMFSFARVAGFLDLSTLPHSHVLAWETNRLQNHVAFYRTHTHTHTTHMLETVLSSSIIIYLRNAVLIAAYRLLVHSSGIVFHLFPEGRNLFCNLYNRNKRHP
jgi:hypothetical protein